MIRVANINDAKAIADIYNYYITHSVISFEEDEVSIAKMRARIEIIGSQYPWLVYEQNQRIVGFAYASQWKSRSAYRFTVEVTIYLSNDLVGKGVGTTLYSALLEALKQTEIQSAVSCIALPNAASTALHKKFGFEKVAHFKRVGRKFDQWIDVGFWQLMLTDSM